MPNLVHSRPSPKIHQAVYPIRPSMAKHTIEPNQKTPPTKNSIKNFDVISTPFPEQMGVSKNKGTPKWMVYNGNPY